MPKIAQYDAPEGLGLRPTETGISAVAGAARRLQGDYSEAAAAKEETGRRFGADIQLAGSVATKYIEHQEISRGANALANFVKDKTKQWNEIAKTADPNDPTVAQKFLTENLEPELAKFRDGFLTEGAQKWGEAHVDQFRQHMFAKTSADMATLAGEAAKLNHRQTVNGLASAAYGDPSSLDFSLKTLESVTEGVVGSSPNLTGTQAAKVNGELLQTGKEAIIKSAVLGMIEKNPNVDLDAIQKKYGEFISGPEIKQFQKAAKTQAKADMLTAKQIEQYEYQQNQRAAHAASNKLMADNVSIDANTGRPTIKPGFFQGALDIAKMPDAPDGLARALLNWGEHQQNLKDQPTRSNPTVRQDLIDGMFRTDNPTSEVDLMRAQVNGELSNADFTAIHRLWSGLEQHPLKDPIVHETLNGVKGLLGTDAVGHGKYASFVQDFVPQYIAMKKAGTLPLDALDLNNKDSMISKAMAPYKRDPTTIMMDKFTRGEGVFGMPGGAAPGTTPPQLPNIPAPDKREVGKTYPTPMGPRVWKGTGWALP